MWGRRDKTHVNPHCPRPDPIQKLMAKALYVSDSVFVDENDSVTGYEVRLNKRTVTDSKPVHVATAILQWSKILFIT